MHSTLAINPDGLPLGIVNQKIYSRPEESEERKELKKRTHNITIPIEEKDSYRWIESLQQTNAVFKSLKAKPITICDREADIFIFFQGGYFKIMLLILIAILALLSIISGAIGGIISKYLFKNKNYE